MRLHRKLHTKNFDGLTIVSVPVKLKLKMMRMSAVITLLAVLTKCATITFIMNSND
jgi:hypothetical protein